LVLCQLNGNLTPRSAIRSLETTHCDLFAQSVGDERAQGKRGSARGERVAEDKA